MPKKAFNLFLKTVILNLETGRDSYKFQHELFCLSETLSE